MPMSSSIVLSSATLIAPDGRLLFSSLDLSFGTERTGVVGRNGVGKTTLLRAIAGEVSLHSGHVSRPQRVGFLRQALQPQPRQSLVDLFGARAALEMLARASRGEASLAELADADWALEARINAALAAVGLAMPIETALARLSGGEATRAQLAALLFAEPHFLLLDEPTNNLDRAGRDAVVALLSAWKGGAIVVSHDRELLDGMDAIVELTSLGATRYGGNWSNYRTLKAAELEAVRHDLADAEKQLADIGRRAQHATEAKARRDGSGRRKAAKADMPRILAGARKDRSEDTGGQTARLATVRQAQAAAAVAAARDRIEVLQPFLVALAPTGLPARKEVMTLRHVSAGYDPHHLIIRDLSFSIVGPERVAIVGPNGVGKTTLLKVIGGQLRPMAGSAAIHTAYSMFDQRVSLLDPAETILENYRRLNPQADENNCRAVLARFLFRAEAAHRRVSQLSGGQVLRAGLACVLGGATPPPLLILDEPTNHLDVESLDTVEAGLRAYDGALLVVSHDEAFLQAIGISRRLVLKEACG